MEGHDKVVLGEQWTYDHRALCSLLPAFPCKLNMQMYCDGFLIWVETYGWTFLQVITANVHMMSPQITRDTCNFKRGEYKVTWSHRGEWWALPGRVREGCSKGKQGRAAGWLFSTQARWRGPVQGVLDSEKDMNKVRKDKKKKPNPKPIILCSGNWKYFHIAEG